jgi:heme A synthase
MFLTGTAWLVADWQKSTSGEDFWHASAAWLLMLHGGGAMVTLLLFGALLPLHAYRAWRGKKNRVSGAVMVSFNMVLIVTSFALYYVASESVRPWMSDIHIAAGSCLPVWLLAHITLGRRASSR